MEKRDCQWSRKSWSRCGSVDILGTEGDFLADKPGRMMFSTQAGGGMPEIGLLPFARVALDVATTVLPTYRSRFSKHQFTQPQLLAILCLMRYEDWTFREAEVRLREHRDLREVLQLQAVPDYTTLFRFLRRLDDDTIDRGLGETVRRLCGGRRRGRGCAAAGEFRPPWMARDCRPRPSAPTSSGASSSTAVGRRAINTI